MYMKKLSEVQNYCHAKPMSPKWHVALGGIPTGMTRLAHSAVLSIAKLISSIENLIDRE